MDLRHLPDLQKKFIACLAKKPYHREKAPLANYLDIATIIIPPDSFYRHGWELNKENILDFNKDVELKVKYMMRQYVAVNQALGAPISNSIKAFQDKFGFSETVWPYDSIKKDFDRHGTRVQLRNIKRLKEEIHNIFLDNLSDLGTVSKKLAKENIYE